MKKIITAIAFILILGNAAKAEDKPGLWDGFKEAAKGVVWMVKVEICKIDLLLFSKDGFNLFNAKYTCEHKDHNLK
jgi:hypothetical protein